MGLVLFWLVFLEPIPPMGFHRALLPRLAPPGTALFMLLAASLSSLCCRQRWRYSFGYSWHGRSVGGLSIAWRAPCFFYSSFLRVLVMQHLWREPYGLQRRTAFTGKGTL